MKHPDIFFGVAGTAGTITLTQVNAVLACLAGLLTVAVMTLRLRREWKQRNITTTKDGDNE